MAFIRLTVAPPPQSKLTESGFGFQDEDKTACFYTMINELKTMADQAEPTRFHHWLKQLDTDGKLHRVYTQNIDCLEQRAGLSFGLGNKDIPIPKRGPPSPKKRRSVRQSTSHSPQPNESYPTPASSYAGTPSPPPPELIPKCIPLHGHLATLTCTMCSLSVPLDGAASASLASDGPAPCPECSVRDNLRREAGQRSRGVGALMPDVVLYNGPNANADRTGEISQRDMLGARPDLVLVVGTSLKVPGTIRIVKELSKVAHPAVRAGGNKLDEDAFPSASQQSNSSSSGRSRKLKPAPVHVVYLNNEFPSPASQFKGVFDVWARGDIQEFVTEVNKFKPAHDALVAKRAREKEAREARQAKAAELLEKENVKARAAGRSVQAQIVFKRAQVKTDEVAPSVVKAAPAAKPKSVVVDLSAVRGKVKSSTTAAARSSRRSSVVPVSRVIAEPSVPMTRSQSLQSMTGMFVGSKVGLAAVKK